MFHFCIVRNKTAAEDSNTFQEIMDYYWYAIGLYTKALSLSTQDRSRSIILGDIRMSQKLVLNMYCGFGCGKDDQPRVLR